MPLSAVSSAGSNYPIQPPTNGTAAYGYVLMGKLSHIAQALHSQATSSVYAVGNSQQDLMNAEVQAIADLAQIHTYLAANNLKDALAAANDFLALNQRYNFSDPNINTLYSQVETYFTMSGGQVTGFKADASGQQLGDWWSSGTSDSNKTPGIETAFAALKLLKQDMSFSPSTQYPGVLVNICILYADALSTSYGKSPGQLDTSFWGTNNLGALFPYIMASYAYAVCNNNGSENWSQFNSMMSKMGTFLKDIKPDSGVTFVNFPFMVKEFSSLQSLISQNPSWPPPQTEGISSPIYSHFLYYAQQGLSSLYGVLFADMYTAWRKG